MKGDKRFLYNDLKCLNFSCIVRTRHEKLCRNHQSMISYRFETVLDVEKAGLIITSARITEGILQARKTRIRKRWNLRNNSFVLDSYWPLSLFYAERARPLQEEKVRSPRDISR
ncbi:hypothetical protein AVEN_188447-1 [Araneus ventricosus]|uniref:Uncharacterized protein n=1 Tax=Araneus ventricosus TaxID=182803 RepID=A0A4Y2H397_ARAVE|nr:hypothetical protein AVEN_188447-1 [Araneus ventricosus]